MSVEDKTPVSAQSLTEGLLRSGLWVDTGVRGVFGYTASFVRIVDGVQSAIDAACASDALERVQFPPLIARETIRRTGYMEGFPQLLGIVHAFDGNERQHAALLDCVQAGEPWSDYTHETELALTPACCYPLYPTLRGRLPEGGRAFDLTSFCFRREPSDDPTRMQSFRMRENVRVGPADAVQQWWADWMERGVTLLQSLGLPVQRALANDPFFGRGGRMLKESQRDQELKFELVAPVCGPSPTALASFNCHRTHFTGTFQVEMGEGELAHSACVGFGLERIALALLSTHGLEAHAWPVSVRQALFGGAG